MSENNSSKRALAQSKRRGARPGPRPLPLSPRNARVALAAGWTLLAAALGSVGVGIAQNSVPQQEVRCEVEGGLPYGVTQASVDAAMAQNPVRSRELLVVRVVRGPMPDAQRFGRVPINADALVSLNAPTDRIGPLASSAPSRGNAVSAILERDGQAPAVSKLSRELDRVLRQNVDAGNGPTAVVQVARALAEGQPGRAWQEPGGWLLVGVGLGSAGGGCLLLGWPRRASGIKRRTVSRSSAAAQADREPQDPATDLPALLEELALRWERMPRGIPGINQERLGAELKRLRKASTAVTSWASQAEAGGTRAALPEATARKTEAAMEPLRQRLNTLQDQLGAAAQHPTLLQPDGADASPADSSADNTASNTADSSVDGLASGSASEDPARRLLSDAARLAAQTRLILGDGPVVLTPAAPDRASGTPSRRANPTPSRRGNPTPSGRGNAGPRPIASRSPSLQPRGERMVRWSLQSLAAAAVGGAAVIPAVLVGYGAELPESSGDQRVERVSIQGDGLTLNQGQVLEVLDQARFPRPQHLVIRVDPAPELVERAVTDSLKNNPDSVESRPRSGREYLVPTSLLPKQTALLRAASPELFDPQTGQLARDTTVVGLWRLADGRLATNMTLTSVAAGPHTGSMPSVGPTRDVGRVVDASAVDWLLGGLETSWPEAAAREQLAHPAVPADATGWVVFGSATVLSLAILRRRYPGPPAQEH